MRENEANQPDSFDGSPPVETAPGEKVSIFRKASFKLKQPRFLIVLVILLTAVGLVWFGLSQGQKHSNQETPLSAEERWRQQALEKAFAPVDCPEPRDPKTLPDGHYKGPMIDTHIHVDSLMDPQFEGQSMAEWICMMDVEGTRQVFGFFPVWEPIIQESLDMTKTASEKYPGRFIPFIGVPDRDGSPNGYPTVSAPVLEKMLSVYPGLFAGYGETGLYARPGGAPALAPDSKRLTEIYPLVRDNRLIVYFHLGEGHKASFERVLESNRDIAFIWHGDQLIECESCSKNLDDIADILEKHPNVYYGIDQLYGNVWLFNPEVTKEQFLSHFKDQGRLLEIDLANWKGLIERYPDQVLWGTDRGAEWTRDPDVALTLNDYERAFIGRLDPVVQEKFAYQNAERLVRSRGKIFRNQDITRDPSIQLPLSIQHVPPPAGWDE